MSKDYYANEEDAIVKAFNDGEITKSQMQKELSELRRQIQQDAQEDALEVYCREMSRY